MIHFKDNKSKSALSTRWAQMSKQEQIIEKKKMEIQSKLEAQKQAAALAAQAKLSHQPVKDEQNSGNIFSNDGSFMNQYKALLEKQKQDQKEKEKQEIKKEEKAKQKTEQTKIDKDEVPQTHDSYDEQHDHYEDRSYSGEKIPRERQPRWGDRGHNIPSSPKTPILEERQKNVDLNSGGIPSLMHMPIKPPNENNSDSEGNHWEPGHIRSDEDSDTNDGQGNGSNCGPMMPVLMPPPLMGPGMLGLGPNICSGILGSESNLGSGPNMGPRVNMSQGSIGLGSNMGPRSMGGGPMGPMGPGQIGPGPMGPRHMRLPPNTMGSGPNNGSGSNQNLGSMGIGPHAHSGFNSSPSNGPGSNMGPGPNMSPGHNMSLGPGMGPRPNMGHRSHMGPGPHMNPRPIMGPRANMGPGPLMGPRPNMCRGPNMGPGPMMGPGGPNMPPIPPGGPMPPFMGCPPNFPMPPNFMGPNGPGGPCGPGPMPPNMCPPNISGPRPNGPMPPFFGPPFPMMGPNGPPMPPNGNMPFMPPFGPNGPPNFDNRNGPPLPFLPPSAIPPSSNVMKSEGNSPGDSKKNISPPLPPPPPMMLIDPKPENMQKSSNTSQVFSPDTFPPSVHRAASEVASNGDHWENVLKAIHSQDQSLWFLQNTNSKEYKVFRDLVNKFRREGVDRKPEVKPEDKYEPEFSLEDDDSNDCKPYIQEESQDRSSGKYNSSYNDSRDHMKREQNSSQSDEESEAKRDRKRKKKSRWSDDPPPADIKPPGIMAPLPPGILPVPKLAKIDEEGLKLTNVNRNNQALMQYAMTNYGTTILSPEDWKKCEDNFKLNLLYQDMLKKRQEVERLAAAGKHKYEYDSDEDTNEGTWEHKLRTKEMFATEKWADELTKQAAGKHHIGDFLPPEELKKFMEKYSALKNGKEPDLSDYKEFKLKEDNVGFKMLQKLGWSEGQGLGAEGSGIVEPINKANQPVANLGLGASTSDVVSPEDDEFDAYRKRMMLAYRFRPNPLNNPRRPYY